VALVGIPVLTAVIGASAVLSAVFGQLIGSLVLVPLTLTLLEAGSPTQEGRKGVAVAWSSLLHAIKRPLVWAPLAGIAMVVAHTPVPDAAQKSLSLIGEAASGVALFSTGLLLSGQKLRIDIGVASNVALKILAQPAVMWLLALLLVVTEQHFREMILLGALPTAVTPSILAVQYKVYSDEADATIFLTTVLSMVTLGVLIALTR
jgi:malonate transporter and related proteins